MRRRGAANPQRKKAMHKWTEATVGRAVSRQLFQSAALVVPCCGWTGHEADLLVVTKDLRVIDVEIKISRADLKADLAKDKWWHRRPWSRGAEPLRTRRDWPPKVWKHYYAVPAAVWDDSLLASVPATSGVLTLGEQGFITCRRNAKPCRDAQRVSAADAVDIARLANLRMWDALLRLDAATQPKGN